MRSSIVLLLALFLFAGCLQRPVQLSGVEVRDYQGENLSSINDFRENSIKGPQYIDPSSYRLAVYGLVEKPQNLTYDQATAYPAYQKKVTLYCVEGWDVDILWEGVLVSDLIDEAEPMPEANTVIFHAYDGYTTSFPMDYIRDKKIIMAYKMNNVTIQPERGYPFMLVAESKWGYKWIKWITAIELSNDTNYQGYWESRGYSDTGDINESYLK